MQTVPCPSSCRVTIFRSFVFPPSFSFLPRAASCLPLVTRVTLHSRSIDLTPMRVDVPRYKYLLTHNPCARFLQSENNNTEQPTFIRRIQTKSQNQRKIVVKAECFENLRISPLQKTVIVSDIENTSRPISFPVLFKQNSYQSL